MYTLASIAPLLMRRLVKSTKLLLLNLNPVLDPFLVSMMVLSLLPMHMTIVYHEEVIWLQWKMNPKGKKSRLTSTN